MDRAIGEAVYDYDAGAWAWSDAMYAVTGLTPAEGDPTERIVERMHPDDRPGILAALEAAIGAGAPLSGQYRVRDDTGRERVIAFVGYAEHDAAGAPVRLRGFAFDVTDAARQVANDAVMAALADRAAIEQVKGALMFAYGVDDAAAFGILTRYSQRANVKVAVIARRTMGALGRRAAAGAVPHGDSLLQLLESASSGDEVP